MRAGARTARKRPPASRDSVTGTSFLVLVLALSVALLPLRELRADPATALYGAAESSFAQGLYGPAAESLRVLLRDHPDDALADDAEYLLALSRLYGGNADQAARSLEQFPRRFPTSPYLRSVGYWLGYARYSLGQAREATAAFRAQVDAYPQESRYRQYSLSYLGELYERAGDLDAALSASRSLLASGAGGELAATALYRIGGISFARGAWGEAEAAFSRIRLEYATSAVALRAQFYEAEALRERGEGRAAARRYQEFLDLATGKSGTLPSLLEDARYRLALLAQQRGDPEAVLAETGRFLADFPASARLTEVLLMRAEVLFDRQDLGAARAAYAQALERLRDPAQRQRVSYNLAVCAAGLGDQAAALQSLEAAAGGPDAGLTARSRYRQAVIHAAQGGAAKALPILQALVAAGGAEEEVLRFLGGLLDDLARPSDARGVWGELVVRFPASPSAPRYLYRRGAAALSLGDHGAALDDFTALVRAHADLPGAADLVAEARYNIGFVYSARGEYVRSLPYFARAREASSDPELRAKCLFAQAVAAYNVEDFAAALLAFRRYAAEVSDPLARGRGLLGQGKTQLRSGDLEGAVVSLQAAAAALSGTEEGAESLFWLGGALMRAARADAARIAYGELLTRYPQSPRVPEAYLRSGMAARLSGELPAALDLLGQAVARLPAGDRSGPREEGLYELGLTALAMDRPGDARRWFGQIGREYPKSALAPEGLLKIAQASFEANRLREAAAGFQEVVRGFPGSEAAMAAAYWGAESSLRAGDRDRAASGFWDYLKRYPAGSYARAAEDGIASVVESTQDPALLRRLYDAAEQDTAVPPSLANRVRLAYASVLLDRGNAREAEAVSRRIAADELAEPFRGQAHLLQGRILRRRGVRDEALVILSSLATSRADRVGAQALLELGGTLAEAGRHREAATELLRFSVLYAQHRDLLPQALYGALLALRKTGDAAGAATLERRLADEFPGWKPPR